MTRTFLILMFSLTPFAGAVNDLILEPSPGMPTITINGVTAIDVRQIGAGGLLSYDLYFRNIDFTFAAAEFRFYYPFWVARFSEELSHWQNNTDAVFVPGPAFSPDQALVLPANPDGSRKVPPNILGNISFMAGLVFRDSMARWKGTPQAPHPGGLLAFSRTPTP